MDPYSILELSRTATEEEIKKKYKQLAKKYHPDRNNNSDESAEKFKQIQAAYSLLTDEKPNLGIFGNEMFGHGAEMFGGNVFGGGGGGDVFGDLFSQLMGNVPMFNKMKGSNIETTLNVTLDQLYKSTNIPLPCLRQVQCYKCNNKKCSNCNGSGKIVKMTQLNPLMMTQNVSKCINCNGTGRNINCKKCRGEGIIQDSETLYVKTEDILKKNRIIIKNKGHSSPNGVSGDLIINILQIAHPIFTRQGYDLKIKLYITLKEALIGFKKEIIHLSGKKLLLSSSNVIQPGTIHILKNEGMLRNMETQEIGNLHIKYIIKFPKEVKDDNIKYLELALD